MDDVNLAGTLGQIVSIGKDDPQVVEFLALFRRLRFVLNDIRFINWLAAK